MLVPIISSAYNPRIPESRMPSKFTEPILITLERWQDSVLLEEMSLQVLLEDEQIIVCLWKAELC